MTEFDKAVREGFENTAHLFQHFKAIEDAVEDALNLTSLKEVV